MPCKLRDVLVWLFCFLVILMSANNIYAANPLTGKPLTENQKRFNEVVDVYAIFGQTSEQLISTFGDPPHSVEYPVASPHYTTDKSNLHIEIHYPDAFFQLIRVEKHINPNAEFYESITLTDERWKLPHGLHVGVKRDTVVSVLGEPYESKKMMDVYTNHFKGSTNPMDANYFQAVMFYYRDGVVRKIQYLFAID